MAAQRIMLIDNEVGLCRMMEAVLKDQGYQIKSYTRPVQAVADFTAGDYDLIISDIKMPDRNGYEVFRAARALHPDTPVILNFVCFWLLQIPLAYFLATRTALEPNGAFIAIVVSESLLTILSVIVFRRGAWKKRDA